MLLAPEKVLAPVTVWAVLSVISPTSVTLEPFQYCKTPPTIPIAPVALGALVGSLMLLAPEKVLAPVTVWASVVPMRVPPPIPWTPVVAWSWLFPEFTKAVKLLFKGVEDIAPAIVLGTEKVVIFFILAQVARMELQIVQTVRLRHRCYSCVCTRYLLTG